MKRRLDRCNKCGEPLRAGICSDEVNCLLDRVEVFTVIAVARGPVGRTHIGRMALPAGGFHENDPINLAELMFGDVQVSR